MKNKFTDSWYKTNKHSLKNDNFFEIYERIFSNFENKPIVFVEVGVYCGGSGPVWKRYFGENSTIIGIDINPEAKKFEGDSYDKIIIGDQGDETFWIDFFDEVGMVDIVLDDGGHQFSQQIITMNHCIPNIKNDGLFVIEDLQTSYFPGRDIDFSFIEYAKQKIDMINLRFSHFQTGFRGKINLHEKMIKHKDNYDKEIYSIQFFNNIASFHINRELCYVSDVVMKDGIRVSNINPPFDEEDFKKYFLF
jgi:hypothetical protein